MKNQGSCHCGKIAYEFEGEIGTVLDCNCSMCQRRGGLLWFVPESAFTLKTSRDDVSTYQFNKHVIQHHFCANCGIAPFGEGTDPKGNKMVAINARCVDGFEPATAKIQHYDGRKA